MTPDDTCVAVTGASRGLGAFIAKQLAAQGFDVAGLARTEALDQVIPIYGCDVADGDAVRKTARRISKAHKPVRAVVNAAGIASMNLVMSTPEQTIEKIIATNLVGTININKSFAKLMVRNGGGRIINFSTIAVSIGLAGEAVYAASKAGVESFSRCFAREVAPHDITVNCVAPGPVDTDLIAKVPSQKIDRIINQQIFREKATPSDIWDVANLLLQPNASRISGEVINVFGA